MPSWLSWSGGDEASQGHSSAERPHLQLHDLEVIGLGEATVIEGVAGAAATQVQVLIHPQTEVTTAGTRNEW